MDNSIFDILNNQRSFATWHGDIGARGSAVVQCFVTDSLVSAHIQDLILGDGGIIGQVSHKYFVHAKIFDDCRTVGRDTEREQWVRGEHGTAENQTNVKLWQMTTNTSPALDPAQPRYRPRRNKIVLITKAGHCWSWTAAVAVSVKWEHNGWRCLPCRCSVPPRNSKI